MTSRQRFHATFATGEHVCAPRHEDLREEVLAQWPDVDVTARCRLERWEQVGPPGIDLNPRPPLPAVVRTEADARAWLAAHQVADRGHIPSEEIQRLHGRDWICGLSFYRGLFQSFGVKDGDSLADHCLFLADHGDLAETMMRHMAEFTATLAAPSMDSIEFDFLLFGEPIASQHGPVISPAMFRRFVLPFYRRLIAVGKDRGIKTFIWESYGKTDTLAMLALEAGCNVLCLRHAAASGIDHLALRAKLGPEIGLIGGIDARTLWHGPAAIDAELERVVPPLLAAGRWLPMIDDRLREGVPLENFLYYRERLDAMLAVTESCG
jgi:hypothetical protein